MTTRDRLFLALALAASCAVSACSTEVPLRVTDEGGAGGPSRGPVSIPDGTPEKLADSPPISGGGLAGAPSISRPTEPVAPPAGATPVCGGDKYTAQQQVLTIYTLFDESGSMLLWWLPVTEAFTAFLRDPRSVGINIGLKFFGLDCQPEVYSVPDVPIAPLPQNADAIADQLALRVPLAQTPTTQAMEGATAALQKYAASHPNEKVVILLVTDGSTGFGEGDEEDCFSTIQQASGVAAQAHASSPSIETYVLGLGDAVGLNMLSEAGGTGTALSADPSVSSRVVDAMHEIRQRALPCDFELPDGADQSPNLVNVEYSAAGANTTTVPGVTRADACDAMRGGWYYDDPDAPTRIVACPATCETFDSAAEVNIVLGCPTIGPQ